MRRGHRELVELHWDAGGADMGLHVHGHHVVSAEEEEAGLDGVQMEEGRMEIGSKAGVVDSGTGRDLWQHCTQPWRSLSTF